jgi:hypothetical protein
MADTIGPCSACRFFVLLRSTGRTGRCRKILREWLSPHPRSDRIWIPTPTMGPSVQAVVGDSFGCIHWTAREEAQRLR